MRFDEAPRTMLAALDAYDRSATKSTVEMFVRAMFGKRDAVETLPDQRS